MAARQWTDEQRKAQAEKYANIKYGYNQQSHTLRRVKRNVSQNALKLESTPQTK